MTDFKDVPVKTQLLYSQDSFDGGINLNSETATVNQVADSRDMWAPRGTLESRPGSKVSSFGFVTDASTTSRNYIVFDDSAGTYTSPTSISSFTFNGDVGDIVYFNFVSTDVDFSYVPEVTYSTTRARMAWEYWDGTVWKRLDAVMFSINSTTNRREQNIYFNSGGSSHNTVFKLPGDFTTTTVDGNIGYGVRMVIRDANVTNGVSTTSAFAMDYIKSFNQYVNIINWAGGDSEYVSYIAGESFTSALMIGGLGQLGSVYYKTINSITKLLTKPQHFGTYDLTVLPEYGVAFFAADGLVFDIYKNSYTQAPLDTTTVFGYAAQVETDANIIGETKSLSSTYIPQETTYPHSKYVLWLNSFLFHAAQKDNPYIVRWSAPSSFAQKGYAVWPKANQTVVLGDDLSPITGLKAFGEHPIVLKRHSMWRMAYVGPGDDNLGIWEAVRITGGVGTLSNSAAVITPVGMVHAYEDGIYVFDGVRSTKVSTPIDTFWNENVNLTNPELFSAGHWRSAHCYLISIPTTDRAGRSNNKVLVWDYIYNSWWIWDLSVNGFFCDERNNVQDKMFYTNADGFIYELTGASDNGTAVSSYITTHRFGYKDNRNKMLRQVYACSTPEAGSVTLSVTTNDRDTAQSGTMTLSDPKEPAAGTLLWNEGVFNNITKKRIRHLNFRERGKWFQVTAAHSTNYKPFKLTQVQTAISLPVDKVR